MRYAWTHERMNAWTHERRQVSTEKYWRQAIGLSSDFLFSVHFDAVKMLTRSFFFSILLGD